MVIRLNTVYWFIGNINLELSQIILYWNCLAKMMHENHKICIFLLFVFSLFLKKKAKNQHIHVLLG